MVKKEVGGRWAGPGGAMCKESKYHKSVLTVSSSMNLDAFRKAGASAFGTSSMNLDDMCTPEALAFRTVDEARSFCMAELESSE